MPEFIVHSYPVSPFGRAVLAVLEEKGRPWRLAALAPGTHRSEPHLARHPFGRVPVLEHDGFVLYETQAIVRYLDRVLPTPPLTPPDPRAAARMDQAMNVNDWYLFHATDVIGFQRMIAPRFMGLAPDEEAIAATMPQAHKVFNELARLLGAQPCFAGENVTLADLMIAPQFALLAQTPEWTPLSAGRQNLVDWLARMNARPSFQATTWEKLTALARAA